MEGLSSILKVAVSRGQMHGIRIAKDAPTVNHLFFADASMLFDRANDHEARVIVDILRKFEGLSRLQINFKKSKVSFSKGLGGDR